MSDGLSTELTGFNELHNNLKRFKGNSLRRIVSRASRASMKETRRKAIAGAKALDNTKTTNQIHKEIITKVNTKSFRSRGNISARVGIRGGAKKKPKGEDTNDVYYWRFLEFGTSKMRARPFMRPAMNPEQITEAFKTELAKSIEKEIQKYGEPM